MRKRTYRSRRKLSRRYPSRQRKRWPKILLIVVLFFVGALVLSLVLGINPLLENKLRAQFGEGFFSDFGITKPAEAGADLESIINNYEPVFTSLEREALERLDDLMAEGLEEYRREERRGTLDQLSLSNKYIQAGRMLEKNVDRLFYDLLESMKKDLAAGGYSAEVATDFEERYLGAKETKKKELLSQLRQHM